MHPPVILPEEILEIIFDYFAYPVGVNGYGFTLNTAWGHSFQGHRDIRERQNTLINICLASKTFHRVAWPKLFEAFPCMTEPWDHDEEPRSLLYLRALCTRPDLGRALKYLVLDLNPRLHGERRTSTDNADWMAREEPGVMAGPLRRLEDMILGVRGGDDLKFRLQRLLEQGRDEAILAMILLLCPNIEKLDLCSSASSTPRSSMLLDILKATNAARQRADDVYDQQYLHPLVFKHLKHLTVLQDVVYGGRDEKAQLCNALSSASLSTLESLSILNFTYSAPRELHFPRLKTLRLPHCSAEANDLEALVSRCPSLLSLEISWSPNIKKLEGPDAWYVPFHRIGAMIATHTPKLENLVLDDSIIEQFGVETLGGSLRDLGSLDRMTVGVEGVWSPREVDRSILDVVPPSVTYLRLLAREDIDTECRLEGWMKEHQLDFLTYVDADLRKLLCDEKFARLKHVVIDYHVYKTYDTPQYDSVSQEEDENYGYEAATEGRRSREIYDSEVAKHGWSMTEDAGGQVHELRRDTRPGHQNVFQRLDIAL